MTDTVASLLRVLENTRANSLDKLENVSPTQVIYEESGWRVKDIIGHLLDWDLEVQHTFEAYHAGGEYVIEKFQNHTNYNQAQADARWEQPYNEIHTAWMATHNKIKALIQKLGDDDLPTIIYLPWGADGSIRLMIRLLAFHEREHLDDIANA